jgi:hypothetical protein
MTLILEDRFCCRCGMDGGFWDISVVVFLV